MLVLAVDTSTAAVTVGVVDLTDDGVTTRAVRAPVDPRAHTELLAPLVREVLAEADVAPGGLGAIACGVGPGPFTGLRVGMATAAALGHAAGIGVWPVCSLDAMAADAGVAGGAGAAGGEVLVVTDARRRELYWATYEGAVRTRGPEVTAPAGVPVAVRVAGLADRYPDAVDTGVRHPSPAGLVTVAAAEIRAGGEPAPLTPLYLRRPDAVLPGPRKRVTP